LSALRSVLDVVGDVERAADPGLHPAVERLLDPVDDRHPVELPAALRRDLERGRIAGGRDVGVDLLPGRLEVVRHLLVGVRGAVEPGEQLGSVLLRLEQVVELEPEALRQLPDVGVALVDQLAAVFRDLALREGAPQRPAPASDPCRRLVDLGGVSRASQRVGGAQACEAGPDHHDPRCPGTTRRSGEASQRRERERTRAGLLDEPRPRRAPLARRELRHGVLNGPCQWCACHRSPLPRMQTYPR
jgi:hypothetical protein